MILGVIADDFTGATAVARMLVRGGMRTVQLIGVPDHGSGSPCDAIAPGVSWTQAEGRPLLPALKSGNFGGVDFFSLAPERCP